MVGSPNVDPKASSKLFYKPFQGFGAFFPPTRVYILLKLVFIKDTIPF